MSPFIQRCLDASTDACHKAGITEARFLGMTDDELRRDLADHTGTEFCLINEAWWYLFCTSQVQDAS